MPHHAYHGTYLIGLLGGWKELINTESLEQCPMHININYYYLG